MTAMEVYEQSVALLSDADQLRLARIIYAKLEQSKSVNASTEWSEEDIQEFSNDSWNRILDGIETEEQNPK